MFYIMASCNYTDLNSHRTLLAIDHDNCNRDINKKMLFKK